MPAAGDARIGFGGHRCRLLVMEKHRCDVGMMTERIVEEHRPATGDEEDMAKTVIGHRLSQVRGDGSHGQV
jgi:hypothetical protein